MVLITILLLSLSRIFAHEILLPIGNRDSIKNTLWLPHNVGTCDSISINRSMYILPKPIISYKIMEKYLPKNQKVSKHVAWTDFDPAEPDTRAVIFQCRAPYPIEVIYEETLNSSFRNPDIERERVLDQKYELNSNVLYFISLQFYFGHIVSANNLKVQCSSIQNPCWGQTAEIKYDLRNQVIVVKLEDMKVNFNNNSKNQGGSATNISTFQNSITAQFQSNNSDTESSTGNTVCKAYFYYRTNKNIDFNKLRNEFACKLENGSPGKITVHPYLFITSIVRTSFRNIHIQPNRCWKKLDWETGIGNDTCQNCPTLELNTLQSQILMCIDPVNSKLETKSQSEYYAIGSLALFGLHVFNRFRSDEQLGVDIVLPDEEAAFEDFIHIGGLKKETYVLNTTEKFVCWFFSYYFAPPFGFAVEYESDYTNDSRLEVYPFTTQERRSVEHGSYGSVNHVKINSTKITRVYCLGFLMRQARWINASISITAYDPTKPSILSGSESNRPPGGASEEEFHMVDDIEAQVAPDGAVENIYLNLHDENKTINCTAIGRPLPNITWTLLNNTFKETSEGLVENPRILNVPYLLWSEITFSKVTAATEGDYVCRAANDIGVAHKIFRIMVRGGSYQSVMYIIAIACSAGVIFVVCSTVLVIQLSKIRKQEGFIRKLTEEEIQEFFYGNRSMHPNDPHFDILSQALNETYNISHDDITIEDWNILGSGQFGMVTKGYLITRQERSTDDDQTSSYCNARLIVAVKTVKSNADVMHVKSLLSEIKIMAYLDRHPNIVQLLGTMTENIQNNEVLMAVELCEYGDLKNYLEQHRNSFENLFFNTKCKHAGYGNLSEFSKGSTAPSIEAPQYANVTRLTKIPHTFLAHSTKDLLEWAKGIANGMVYLGQKKVIHGDLAARNILLSDGKVAKISDFGLSRQLLKDYTVYSKKTVTPLPWKWLAIESLKYQTFSLKSDVWSFGVVLWEIFSIAEVPYPGFYYNQEFMDKIEQGYRLPQPEFANNELYEIMACCWEAAPEKRPEAGYILQTLSDIVMPMN